MWSAICGEYARKCVGRQPLSLFTGSPLMDYKSIAKASKVRILHLPPRAERTCGNAGQGPFVWSGCDGVNRLSTAFAGNTWGVGHVRLLDSRGQRQRRLDARLRDIFLAMGALAWTLRTTFTLGSAPRRPRSVGPRHSAKAKRPRGAGRTDAWPAARRTRYR